MQKYCIAVLLLRFAAVSLAAADSRENEILNREKAFWSAWYHRDPEAMAKLITDDLFVIPRTARSVNRDQFLQDLKAGRFTTGSGEFSRPADLLIRFYGSSTAIVTYGFESSHSTRFTHVWVNVDGKGWRMASFHSSLPFTLPKQ
jgi:hypothetical protein